VFLTKKVPTKFRKSLGSGVGIRFGTVLRSSRARY